MTAARNPGPVDIHIGKRLREQRCYAGMTQTALAGSAGITFQQLQKYEQGANRVPASRLWEFAGTLHAPVESFFPAASSGRSGLAWMDDPGFAQWVRLYHDTPEETRRMLLQIARIMAKEELAAKPEPHA